jgi:voltage-gated potassium channel Kch
VGLGQAAQGDPQTFVVGWASARAAGLVSAELAAHVATVGAGYDLPADFLAQLET